MKPLKQIRDWYKRAFHSVKIIESAIVGCLLWWAFILIVPLNTFETSIAYKAMAGIASEEVWSGVFFIVGILALYGMLTERYWIRRAALVLSNGLWFFVATMFAIGTLATTGTGIYFVVACLNAYVVYKVGEEHGN